MVRLSSTACNVAVYMETYRVPSRSEDRSCQVLRCSNADLLLHGENTLTFSNNLIHFE